MVQAPPPLPLVATSRVVASPPPVMASPTSSRSPPAGAAGAGMVQVATTSPVVASPLPVMASPPTSSHAGIPSARAAMAQVAGPRVGDLGSQIGDAENVDTVMRTLENYYPSTNN